MDKKDLDTALALMDDIRALGCAVIIITPEDVQTLTADDDDQPTISDADVFNWMQLHAQDIEDAILGDYWGDTVRDVLNYHPIKADADLDEANDGELCTACGRDGMDCSRDPCAAVIADRAA